MIVVTLSHDDELVLKGDNVTLGYVEYNDSAKEILKAALLSHIKTIYQKATKYLDTSLVVIQ